MKQQSRGFVLLLVLLTIAVMAAALVVAAQRALAKRAAADELAQTLQAKWAVRTLSPLLEASLPTGLESPQTSTVQGIGLSHQRQTVIPMGIARIQLTLANEQAKASIPALWETRSEGNAERVLQELLTVTQGATPRNPVAIRLRPLESSPSSGAVVSDGRGGLSSQTGLYAFQSFAQIYWREPGGDGWTATHHEDSLTLHQPYITLWGDGKLDLLAAPAPVIHAVMRPHLTMTDAKLLLERLDAFPHLELRDALGSLDLSRQALDAALERGRLGSDVWSLHVLIDDLQGVTTEHLLVHDRSKQTTVSHLMAP